MFNEGYNCWQTANAKRLSVLVSGAAYFKALRETIKQAQHSVMIVGWDIDSRTQLLRDAVQDDLPIELGAFLDAIVRRRPQLNVYLLTWDFAALYWPEREWFSHLKLHWGTHKRLKFALDNTHAVAGSHHQKIVVVDDAVAFVGGLDLTKRRWDTPKRYAKDPRRTDTEGEQYPPFHDMQMIVDGEAAVALGDLFRSRWQQATEEKLERPPAITLDPWPIDIEPLIDNAEVAIARTEPGYDDQSAVREVEQLYLDLIAAARQMIYIENQYLTSHTICTALCKRLGSVEGPEIIMVLPERTSGWLEQVTMDVLRARLLKKLRSADFYGRLRIYYPVVPGLGDDCINVHAKLMIVDDQFLRIGSANLSNRSTGLDTECDLAVEGNVKAQRSAIAGFRNHLLGQHLGIKQSKVTRSIVQRGSVIDAIESLRGGDRSLQVLDGQVSTVLDRLVPQAAVIDPEQPISSRVFSAYLMSVVQLEKQKKSDFSTLLNDVMLLSFGLALRLTPLNRWLDNGLNVIRKPLDVSLNLLDSFQERLNNRTDQI
jgi:phosphatidylserine/phosphatidylglycerophosphate/cardiolipin synthase-like enzyme